MFFEHEDIFLRPIEKSDLEFLRQLHNDWSTLKNLTDTSMVTEIQQEKWYSSVCSSSSSARLAVLIQDGADKRIIGCIRLDHIDARNRSVQVGGDIAKEYRGKGLGTKMFSACLKYVFDVMNVHRAYLSVLETNLVAKNMYQKHGFIEEGRQVEALFRSGRYYDYIDMYLLEQDYRRVS